LGCAKGAAQNFDCLTDLSKLARFSWQFGQIPGWLKTCPTEAASDWTRLQAALIFSLHQQKHPAILIPESVSGSESRKI
jgi:hypothetical protein